MTYVITRIATKNPYINGRKLYLADSGLWTLDRREARTFEKRESASWALHLYSEPLHACVEELA